MGASKKTDSDRLDFYIAGSLFGLLAHNPDLNSEHIASRAIEIAEKVQKIIKEKQNG